MSRQSGVVGRVDRPDYSYGLDCLVNAANTHVFRIAAVSFVAKSGMVGLATYASAVWPLTCTVLAHTKTLSSFICSVAPCL